MKKTLTLLTFFALALLVALTAFAAFRQKKVTAAPEVFQSGLSGGCYIAAPNSCKIHVDPFTINVDDGANEKLVEFQLRANGVTLYQFKTDQNADYRPAGDYSPSLVAQDFAATCGETYDLELLARDEGDGETLYVVASTAEFTCPSTVP
ncbi:MAG: hypothetical protein Fur0022_37010 [Anaerolineales bacterium]